MNRNLTLHLIFHPLHRCLVPFIARQAHRHLYLTVYTLLFTFTFHMHLNLKIN